MPMTCSIRGCRNRASKKDNIQYFNFPFKDERRLTAWINAINRPQWTPTKNSRICSQHFIESDYLDRPGGYIKHLKPNAVPSIFMSPYELQEQKIKEEKQDTNKEKVDLNIDNESMNMGYMQTNINNTDVSNCSCTELCLKQNVGSSGPSYIVVSVQECTADNKINSDSSDNETESVNSHKELMLRHKVRMLQQKVRRQNKKINSLKLLLKDLKKTDI